MTISRLLEALAHSRESSFKLISDGEVLEETDLTVRVNELSLIEVLQAFGRLMASHVGE